MTTPEAEAATRAAALSNPAPLAVLAATLMFGAFSLPHLSPVMALILWAALGLVAAVPLSANAAVARGHSLKIANPANPFTRLRRSGVVRLLACAALGLLGAALLLLQLAQAGVAAGAGALAGAATVIAILGRADTLARWFDAPVHDAARLRGWALVLGALAMAIVSGGARALIGYAEPGPIRATSALVAEGLAAQRLVEGGLAWLLGSVAALELLPRAIEAVLSTLALGVSGAAVAALTIAALMPARDWARAVGVASDASEPPAPQRAALLAGAGLVALILLTGLRAEMTLAVQPPEMRPVAQVQITVERIGRAYFPEGTQARIAGGRAEMRDADAAVIARMRARLDTLFDTMEDQVDPFLDSYYSLGAEYTRLGVALMGFLGRDPEAAMQDHIANRLRDALDADALTGTLHDWVAAQGVAEARAMQALDEARLARTAVAGVNPARLRVVADYPEFPPLPELQSLGLTYRIEQRLGASVAVGTLGAVVAQRVVQRLVRRGVLRLGARAVLASLPLVGTAIAVGTDAAILRLEEHNNRADFRAEIMDALSEQRAEALAQFDTIARE